MGRLRAAAIAVALLLLASGRAHAGPAKLVKDIERSSTGCSLSRLAAGPGALYMGTDATCRSGLGLWRTDGSADGTWVVASFEPGPRELSHVEPILAVGNVLYFDLTHDLSGDFGRERLWRSDGTAAGTFEIHRGLVDSGLLPAANGFLLERVCSRHSTVTSARSSWMATRPSSRPMVRNLEPARCCA